MDIKNILEKFNTITEDPKFTGYYKGTDKGPVGDKLVGEEEESIIKDLSKGKTPKTLEEELAEKWAEFKDTLARRPAREGSRHARGHKPQEQYTIIKDDEEESTDWKLEQWQEQDDDRSTWFHQAVKGDEKVLIDWNSWSEMTDKEFKIWLALDMPTREDVDSIGPLYPKDLQTLLKTKQGTHAVLKLDEYKVLPLKDKEEYDAKMLALQTLQSNPSNNQEPMKSQVTQRMAELQAQAKQQGIVADESKASKTLDTWFKNKETRDKFAKGEIKVPDYSKVPRNKPYDMSKFKKIVDEYGTEGTTGTVGTTGTTGTDGEKPDAEQLKNVAQATSTLKQATGSVVQPGALAKAIDAASQGKTTSQQDMKALEPMMDIIKTTAENPELANQMKPLIQRAKQLQQKP